MWDCRFEPLICEWLASGNYLLPVSVETRPWHMICHFAFSSYLTGSARWLPYCFKVRLLHATLDMRTWASHLSGATTTILLHQTPWRLVRSTSTTMTTMAPYHTQEAEPCLRAHILVTWMQSVGGMEWVATIKRGHFLIETNDHRRAQYIQCYPFPLPPNVCS